MLHKKTPELLVCFDPGQTVGVSVWIKQKLVFCGYGRIDKDLGPKNILNNVYSGDLAGGTLIVERPMSYSLKGKRMLVNPNDLLQTDFRAGLLSGYYLGKGMDIEEIRPPSLWKGQVPDDVILERVLDKTSDTERELIWEAKSARAKKLDHNMIDAIGMGLWRLNRWRKQ